MMDTLIHEGEAYILRTYRLDHAGKFVEVA